MNKSNLRDLIAATGLAILLKLDLNRRLFCPKFRNSMDDLKTKYGTTSILRQALYITSKLSVNSNWSYSPEKTQFGSKFATFVPIDLKPCRMTLKNNGAPILCHSNFVHHCIDSSQFKLDLQSGNQWFFVTCDLEIWRMTLKIVGHIFYVT